MSEEGRQPDRPSATPGDRATDPAKGVSPLIKRLDPALLTAPRHPYSLRPRSNSESSASSGGRGRGRYTEAADAQRRKRLNPRVVISRVSSLMDPETTDAARITTLENQNKEILAAIRALTLQQGGTPVPEVAPPAPPAEGPAPVVAAAAPAPANPLGFNRSVIVEELRKVVTDPTSRKFNTGQKEELKFLFLIEEIFDILPLRQQTALLERLRLFTLVLNYNWATALRDRDNQGITKAELVVDDKVIIRSKPRRTRFGTTAPRKRSSGPTKKK